MTRWDLERGIYPLATALFRFNYLPAVTIALIQAVLQTLPLAIAGGTGAMVVSSLAFLGASFLQVVLLYTMLFTLMTGDSAIRHAFPWPRFWGFFGRLLLLGVPAAVVMLPALVGGNMFFGLLSFAVSFATLGYLGTVLPDLLAGGRGRLGDAIARGHRSFGSFLVWMLAGPVLASILLGIGIGVVSGLLLAIGVGASGSGEAVQPSAWFLGLITLLGALGGAYIAGLMAAVLARTWAAGGGKLTPSR